MLRKDPFITGEIYHIFNRGIDKREIFKSDFDYQRFIMLLYIANSNNKKTIRLDDLINKSKKTFEEVLIYERGEVLVSIACWCLMTNHFHILVKQEVDGGITKLMRKIGVGFSMYFNIKYQRQGALFGGLFKSVAVQTDNHLMHLFGYIHLNPLDINHGNWREEIGKIDHNTWKNFLENYRYSSFKDHVGVKRPENSIIRREAFPEYFQSKQQFDSFIDNYLIEI